MSTKSMAIKVCEHCGNWQIESAILGEKKSLPPESSFEQNHLQIMILELSRLSISELHTIRDYLNGVLGH